MIQSPIIEMDVHGLTVDAAIAKIETQVKKAGAGVYRVRVIHGLNPRVIRIAGGDNPGVTELVLREY